MKNISFVYFQNLKYISVLHSSKNIAHAHYSRCTDRALSLCPLALTEETLMAYFSNNTWWEVPHRCVLGLSQDIKREMLLSGNNTLNVIVTTTHSKLGRAARASE